MQIAANMYYQIKDLRQTRKGNYLEKIFDRPIKTSDKEVEERDSKAAARKVSAYFHNSTSHQREKLRVHDLDTGCFESSIQQLGQLEIFYQTFT